MGDLWLVVFCDLGNERPEGWRGRLAYWFIRRFLKRGFRHVFAITAAEHFDGYLVIDPSLNALGVMEAPSTYLEEINGAVALGEAHIFAVEASHAWGWQPRFVFSCVGIVKHIVGEKGWSLTPWQLYKALCRRAEAEAQGDIHHGQYFRRQATGPGQ